MPELPEVETIVRKLALVLPGQVIKKVTLFHPKTFHGDSTSLVGLKVENITRRAKIMRFNLSDGRNLVVHLKMTGQLIYVDGELRLGGGHPTADWVHDLPSKHTRVMVEFEQGKTLFFNDQRLFGWMKLVTDEEVAALYSGLGPDVTDPALTTDYLVEAFRRKSVPIKVAIMDNAIMCGLGNIYACDALNLAKIHPQRPAKSLSETEVDRLLKASQETLTKGIELGGTTFDGKYVDVDGFAGQYQSVVRVYGREGKPCLNCGHSIVKTKLGGRGTYFCPNCQV